MKSRKAQMSAEFMISLAIMLVIFLLLSGIASQRYVQVQQERVSGSARAILETFVMNVNAVNAAGEGAWTRLDLPEAIDSAGDYRIVVPAGSKTASIIYDNPQGTQFFVMPMVTSALGGRVDGINGTVTIRNSQGAILIG